jgi:cell wall-associated NlpC family hydrolase
MGVSVGARPGVLLVFLAIGTLPACAARSGATLTPSPFPGAVTPASHAAPNAPAAPGSASAAAAPLRAVVDTALTLRGVSYRLGGEDPDAGFDCSGFVKYVFAQHGIDAPRTVGEQVRLGREIALSDVQAGDLLFFDTSGSGPSHVGLVVGSDSPGAFIHAPGSGGVVRVENAESSYWRSRFVFARRVW